MHFERTALIPKTTYQPQPHLVWAFWGTSGGPKFESRIATRPPHCREGLGMSKAKSFLRQGNSRKQKDQVSFRQTVSWHLVNLILNQFSRPKRQMSIKQVPVFVHHAHRCR